MHTKLSAVRAWFSLLLWGISSMVLRHRLLVVFPLFAAIIAVSAYAAPRATRGQLAGAVEGPVATQTTVYLGRDATAVLQPNAILDTTQTPPVLKQGSVLLQADGMTAVQAGDLLVQGWHGGFVVSMQGNIVSIAAVTSPVLVGYKDARTLVPVQMQWRGAVLDAKAPWRSTRVMKPLPTDYVQEQMVIIEEMQTPPSVASLQSSFLPMIDSFLDFFRLPAAITRASEQRSERAASSIVAAVRHGERADVLSLLEEGAWAGMLSSPAGQRVLPSLLPEAAKQGFAQWFATVTLDDDDRLLLASIHPLLRDHAWVAGPDRTLSTGNAVLRMISLPFSDTATEGASDLVIERWGQSLGSTLRSAQKPPVVAAEILRSVTVALDRCQKLGYPRRAQRYAASALQAIAPWKGELAGTVGAIIDHMEAIRKAPLPDAATLGASVLAQAAASSAAASSAPAPVLLSAEELQARTRELLEEAGALFTVQTVIEPIEKRNAVRVTGVAIPTASGDQMVAFSYDLDRGVVFDITKDGQPLPYDVPLAGYLEWVKGE